MWSILTYYGLKLGGRATADLGSTNQNSLLTYKERGYKVGNAGIELSQITGLVRNEGVARVGN